MIRCWLIGRLVAVVLLFRRLWWWCDRSRRAGWEVRRVVGRLPPAVVLSDRVGWAGQANAGSARMRSSAAMNTAACW